MVVIVHNFLVLISLSFFATATLADPVGISTADSHAPLGVMGDHVHKPGEWMASYRYMRMEMRGNRDGKDDLSPQQVLAQGFMVTPLQMSTEMHMFGMMFAATQHVTLMTMLPYVERSMDHINGLGRRFATETSGLGDLKVSGLIQWINKPETRVHATVGFSVPTGAIDRRDRIPTPMGVRMVQLPYPMQIGSGTLDFLSGLTYNGHRGLWSWGAQASSVYRLEDENSQGYSLGNEGLLTAWGARRFNQNLSASLRMAAKKWGNIDGADPLLNPKMVPTADPKRRGGERFDIGVGVNLLGTTGAVAGQRLAIEWLQSIEEDLQGPQLKSDGMLTLGWQYAWN